jgi:selenide,water dikinase
MKAGLISHIAEQAAIESMATLNKNAAEIMASYPVNACTDVTGFGLLGHALEMAIASKTLITLEAARVPLLPEVLDAVQMGLVPAGSFANRQFCAKQLREARPVDPMLLDILADAQTSGGLLISLPEEKAPALVQALRQQGVADAAIIGRASEAESGAIELA